MTLPTTAYLPFAKRPGPALPLEHELTALPNTQARFLGRSALKPVLDLDAYRYEALIDWIDLTFSFKRRTQIQHVHDALKTLIVDRKPHIDPIDKGEGNTFSQCTMRIQEPGTLAHVSLISRHLCDTFGADAEPLVAAIEISLDIYPRHNTPEARQLLLGALQRTIWTKRDIWSRSKSRPRMVYAKGRKSTLKLTSARGRRQEKLITLVPYLHTPAALDSTLYFGARKGDNVMIRMMEKILDAQRPDGTRTELSNEQCRVRAEVTLRGDELLSLGLSKVSDLSSFEFKKLKKRYFQFMLPTFVTDQSTLPILRHYEQWSAKTYLRSGVLGLIARERASDQFREGRYSEFRDHLKSRRLKVPRMKVRTPTSNFVAWAELHVKLDAAFQQLDKRQATAFRKLKAAPVSHTA